MLTGKEALIALANGEDIQFCDHMGVWHNAGIHTHAIGLFLNDCYEFRLKPRTITINGIEVPAPFEPKDGDEFWILFESHYSPCGYKLVLPDSQYSELCYGAWHTEDEIKQVVAALRSIFK